MDLGKRSGVMRKSLGKFDPDHTKLKQTAGYILEIVSIYANAHQPRSWKSKKMHTYQCQIMVEPEGAQQERDETQPPASRELPAETEGDQEYRTCSRRVSKRPVRFGELTDQ